MFILLTLTTFVFLLALHNLIGDGFEIQEGISQYAKHQPCDVNKFIIIKSRVNYLPGFQASFDYSSMSSQGIFPLKKFRNQPLSIRAWKGIIYHQNMWQRCSAAALELKISASLTDLDRCSGLSHYYNGQAPAQHWFALLQRWPTAENSAVTRKGP